MIFRKKKGLYWVADNFRGTKLPKILRQNCPKDMKSPKILPQNCPKNMKSPKISAKNCPKNMKLPEILTHGKASAPPPPHLLRLWMDQLQEGPLMESHRTSSKQNDGCNFFIAKLFFIT